MRTKHLTASVLLAGLALAGCSKEEKTSAHEAPAAPAPVVTKPGQVVSCPFRITRRLPSIATGTIGRPASIASRKMPPLKRATRPSRLRVPSGKTMSECEARMSAFTLRKTVDPGFCRCTSDGGQTGNLWQRSDRFLRLRDC